MANIELFVAIGSVSPVDKVFGWILGAGRISEFLIYL